ncbi:hypothetical protein [Pseudomonas orientalis]|uniref:hypothetical protein n=1 Tax=Pseudomonas orientalis TaxID=76758 RepID=UPI001F150B92|nr:hypothetical protein [Pseudomonas orientalis]
MSAQQFILRGLKLVCIGTGFGPEPRNARRHLVVDARLPIHQRLDLLAQYPVLVEQQALIGDVQAVQQVCTNRADRADARYVSRCWRLR